MSGKVLITGADGYVGSLVARELLKNSHLELLLWVRARNESELALKVRPLQENLGAWKERFTIVAGDLRQENPFEQIKPRDVQKIIHAAAVTRFNVEEDLAREVNERGSYKLFEFAKRCPHLDLLSYVSTLYTSGLRSGVIEEIAYNDEAGFANFYEQSKWKAEQKLIHDCGDLPWQICRVSTVMADDATGYVSQYNAFHNTLKLLYYGLISLMPGETKTRLYFVTGDFVAKALSTLLKNGKANQIYHLSSASSDSLDLGRLVDLSFEIFEKSSDFKMRRILKPLFTDYQSFDLLSKGVKGMGGEILSQAMASVSPFAKQLFVQKEVRCENLFKDWKEANSLPRMENLVTSTLDYLVRSKFGRLEVKEGKSAYAG